MWKIKKPTWKDKMGKNDVSCSLKERRWGNEKTNNGGLLIIAFEVNNSNFDLTFLRYGRGFHSFGAVWKCSHKQLSVNFTMTSNYQRAGKQTKRHSLKTAHKLKNTGGAEGGRTWPKKQRVSPNLKTALMLHIQTPPSTTRPPKPWTTPTSRHQERQ